MRQSKLVHVAAALAMAVSCVAFAADTPKDAPMTLDRPVVGAQAALGQTIHELKVDAVAFSRVIDFLRDVSGANIVVNWKVLEAAGVARDTPVTLQVRELTLRKMLQLVLDQASPAAGLTYSIDSNVMEITTQEEADKQMILKIYDVDDLVMPDMGAVKAPSFNLDDITKSGSTSGGSTGGGGGGGGGSLFGSDTSNQQTSNEQTRQKRGDDLAALIREVIRPTIWKENGGPATVKYTNGKLIVSAPASVQESIGGPVNMAGQRFGM